MPRGERLVASLAAVRAALPASSNYAGRVVFVGVAAVFAEITAIRVQWTSISEIKIWFAASP